MHCLDERKVNTLYQNTGAQEDCGLLGYGVIHFGRYCHNDCWYLSTRLLYHIAEDLCLNVHCHGT